MALVFLAFERPSRLQWTCLHPSACYNNETHRGSNDRRVCRQPGGYSSFSKFVPTTEAQISAYPLNRKKVTRRHVTRTRNARGRGNAQAHTKIQKFLLRGLWPFIRNFAPTKISLYTVPVEAHMNPSLIPRPTHRTRSGPGDTWRNYHMC